MHVLCHLVEGGGIEFVGAESRRERRADGEREKRGSRNRKRGMGDFLSKALLPHALHPAFPKRDA